MDKLLSIPFVLAFAVTAASADSSCISATSWGDPRVDLVGAAPDNSIWHKFYTGYDWQPELFERIPSEVAGCPSVSSWGYGRLDLVWIGRSKGNVLHKYFDGGNWGPSWEDAIDLGGDINIARTHSWGKDRLDIVGTSNNGSFMHKAWTGRDYYPTGQEWEDLGGNFSSVPGIGSWGPDRFDIVGIAAETGSLQHKYWAVNTWSDWEDLEGGPFLGDPAISSWGSGRLDLWAIDKQGLLNHKFWDGFQWNGWEKMGGKFSQAPQVVHWSPGKIDIVGKNSDDDKYYLKSFDGSNWNPSLEGWYSLSGPYSSEPCMITKATGQNFLYLFGIDTESSARMQIWSGYEWQPSAQETWSLGNVSKPYPEEKSDSPPPKIQHVPIGTEL
ncbi:putative carbohydrate-binding protein [Rosellinia necatrix]|uniref:Putative carbohydrate-binding protein n=1 Tax=Rosellinia necatrix TaxID=77044 RepID=A0A1W2TJC5_ROSNE|nr:putative carbohydrate-binding protein [Rosellinia necatrix]